MTFKETRTRASKAILKGNKLVGTIERNLVLESLLRVAVTQLNEMGFWLAEKASLAQDIARHGVTAGKAAEMEDIKGQAEHHRDELLGSLERLERIIEAYRKKSQKAS